MSRWSSALHVPHHSVAWPMPRPRSAASLAGSQMHGSQEIFCGIPGASECPYGQRSGFVGEQWCRHPMIMPLNCKFQSAGSTRCHHTGDDSKCLQASGRAGRVASGLLGVNQLEEACTRLSGRGIPVHDVPSARGEYRDARPYQGRRQAVHCCRERSPVRLAALLRMDAWRLTRPGLDRRLRNRSCLRAYGTARLAAAGFRVNRH
jgi:hypothetical protein